MKLSKIALRDKINSLPDDKIVDWSKLKAFADNKINVAEMMISLPDMIENIVGKGENAGYSIFSFSHNVFSKDLFFRVVKSRDCVVKRQVEIFTDVLERQ